MSNQIASDQKLRINGPRETYQAITDARFERIAHIYHLEWHGVRSATSCLPGHKVGISADHALEGETIRRIVGFVYEEKIEKVVFQAYSINADMLARALHREFGRKIRQYVITHVTSTQFEYTFEIDQQKRIIDCFSEQILSRLGSVKPNFYSVIPQYHHRTIYNAPPRLASFHSSSVKSEATVFVPLENTLRKNLYTNIIAGINSPSTNLLWTVNYPTGLESVLNIAKCRVIGYQRGSQLYDRMAESAVVLNCTLAECQPMTQLEALAVGTPCLTGRLGLAELDDHSMTKLFEVTHVDSPYAITEALEAVLHQVQHDAAAFYQELKGYLAFRSQLSLDSLADFLEI